MPEQENTIDREALDEMSFEDMEAFVSQNIFQKKSNQAFWKYLREPDNVEETREMLANIHRRAHAQMLAKSKRGEDIKGTRIWVQEIQNRQTGTNKVIDKLKGENKSLIIHQKNLEISALKAKIKEYEALLTSQLPD